ncbi:MAG: ABC transporter permease [Candidatus Zixiibacteriota bacterium]|nr:MAG: ABC transporter permease [candidate division Zixibacteria bacterium]
MIRNYLTVALRNFLRHKGYAAINIVGLAFGMASCLLVLLFVWHELSYDTYHPDHERLYRISTMGGTEADVSLIAGCSENVTPHLRENYPEVEQVFRIQPERPRTVRFNDQAVQVDNIKYAENDLLTMFHMPVIHGSSTGALERPHTVVLTRPIAEQLFGVDNPVGQTIQIDTAHYEITAVVDASPTNTHLKFGIIVSWSSMQESDWRHSWDGGFFKTYVKLAEGTDPDAFESQIATLIHEQIGERLAENNRQAILFLQPVSDIHLYSHCRWEAEAPGNINNVYIFSVVGLIVLLIACLNFMNLSTARAASRASEVGTRKVVGAARTQLMGQFLGETLLTALLALAIALLLVDVSLPAFNGLAGTGYLFADVFNPVMMMIMGGMVLLVGGVAGIYPAFVLSSHRPAHMLRQTNAGHFGGRNFRRAVVVIQFALAVIMIVGTMTVYKQLDYMREQPLGFDLKQKLVMEMPRGAVTFATHNTMKYEFTNHPAVTAATFSTSVPGRWNYQWRCFPTGEAETNMHTINWYGVDRDFLESYDIELIAGETFLPDCRGAMCEGILLNEAAVRTFGWGSIDETPGKHLWAENRPVIGVIRDFHLKGLQSPVEPMGMFIMGEDFRYLTLSIDVNNLRPAMTFVQETYDELIPDELFNFFFLDEDFDRQYRAEQKLGTIFGAFALLGVMIAGLGLFGMASYSAQLRTKEIGVRKVLGATVGNVVNLLTREIIVLVVTANALAWPVAYLAADEWLATFAYHTSLGWMTFAWAALSALAVAVVAVGYQSFKAARANPVEALKYE